MLRAVTNSGEGVKKASKIAWRIMWTAPYAHPCIPPVVANFPPGFSSYHLLSADHAYGAVIRVRDSVAKAGNIVCKHMSNFAACVELSTMHGPFAFPPYTFALPFRISWLQFLPFLRWLPLLLQLLALTLMPGPGSGIVYTKTTVALNLIPFWSALG